MKKCFTSGGKYHTIQLDIDFWFEAAGVSGLRIGKGPPGGGSVFVGKAAGRRRRKEARIRLRP